MDFITQDTIRKNNLAAKREIKKAYTIPGAPVGEMAFKHTGNGSKRIFTKENLSRYFDKDGRPTGEMMSLQDLRSFMQQSVLDVTAEQEEHPTIYKEIYDEIVSADFTETINVQDIIGLVAAFGVVHDGESVELASFKALKKEVVNMLTFAVGYSVSSDWLAYNQFWKVGQANKALGLAYNAILDHIHLSPIVKATYASKAVTNKVTTGATDLENVWLTLRQGLKDALARRSTHGYRLRPTVALCNSSTAMDVESAVKGLLQKGSQLGQLGVIQKVIAYDGWEGEVNGILCSFEAPKDNEVYLIQPKQTFKALVKTDLAELRQRGDIMRLSELEVVQYFRRGVIADVENSVHKVLLA